ncbi:unnamed protein product [Rotaria magnacalcarata]|uniref:Spermatogenesis-associated protein 1 C-terminal domain-containing protein n=4 Tax=Rotaria magnacalcarata TaxID=392030 RepID=A0A819DQ78_9BILA|nr:unnamed protein product [Rotaria magnacalcarata]CAF2100498.1 unnamed protein product [Rotaria magnacalcarata]CAF2127071.1 unnamed protein product [Rotaria magnacalcarata]CAF2184899.1 unnamed protein product [Rotaria magnacalcarata]CAF3795551.1 unnamed protein product [Rotaria magnacalcarata]
MLQTYLGNEQLNSLPKTLINNRSRNGFIAINRPDSAQLVDLHIFIIPKSVWKNVQHLAQNGAMDDAISVGFVRVPPDLKLHELRQSIERLCGTENNFPRDFIFLRSVGRCFTRVKSTQENELKVKHYRPPLTSAPEIYLLEGRHEDYAYTPSTTPTMCTANYLFGSRYQYRLNLDEFNTSTSRVSSNYQPKLLTDVRHQIPIANAFTLIPNTSSPSKLDWTKFTRIDLDESTPNISGATTLRSRKTPSLYRELIKLQEEQERLRQRQDELERIRRDVEEKKVNSDREEENNRRRRRQEKAEDEHRRRLEKETRAATKIQASYRGFKDRKVFQIIKQSITKNKSRISLSETDASSKQSIDDEEKSDNLDDDEFSDGSQILSISSSIKSASDTDSNPYKTETSTIKRQNSDSTDSNSFSSLSESESLTFKTERKVQSDKVSYSKNKDINDINTEITRSATVTKVRYLEHEFLSVSRPNITDDTYELERQEAEAKQRRQLDEEKRRRKKIQPQGNNDAESLRIRLQELRTERMDLEKTHNDVIRKLKHIHSRITLRRREARDMWKKKYYRERKKTVPLEESSVQLKRDLDQINTKIVQSIDSESKQAAQAGNAKLAEMGSLVLQITRFQNEIQNIRNQIDLAKLRLTTDIKLRNQAENEGRILKAELSQAKMNLHHIKNRITT